MHIIILWLFSIASVNADWSAVTLVAKDGPVSCLAFEVGNKATSLVGLTRGGSLLVFNASSSTLISSHAGLIPRQYSTICTLEGHGLYLFVYLAEENQVVKYALNGPVVTSVIQLKARTDYGALLYNSLGNGYLVAPSRIVPLDFFHGQSDEGNTTLLPPGFFEDAALDIWAGYRGGGDTNLWVNSGDTSEVLVFACNTTASVASAPYLIANLSMGESALGGPFSIDYSSRRAYFYDAKSNALKSFAIGSASAPRLSPSSVWPLVGGQKLLFRPLLLPQEAAAEYVVWVLAAGSDTQLLVVQMTTGLAKPYLVPLAQVSAVTVSGPRSLLLCGSNDSVDETLAFCVSFTVDHY